MMKQKPFFKRLFILLILTLALTACLVACSGGGGDPGKPIVDCKGNHTYGEHHDVHSDGSQDCVWLTCTACGQAVQVPASEVEHTLVLDGVVDEGDCQTTMKSMYTCSVCGWQTIREGDYGRHDWGSTSTALCGEEGYFERSCFICGKSESGTTLGLTHELIHYDREEPECETYGHEAYDACARCSYNTYVSIDPTYHSNTTWQITLAPTETTKGVREIHCPDCGYEDRVEVPESIYTDFLLYGPTSDGTGTLAVVGIDRRYAPEVSVISVPASYMGTPITEIADGAFADDTVITELDTSNSKIMKIGISAFSGCTSLAKVTLGEWTESIRESAFEGCGALAELQVEHVNEICMHAFKGVGLQSLNIECYVGEIESEAFADCKSLKTLSFAGIGYVSHGILTGCTAIESLTVPYVGTTNDDTLSASYPLAFLFGVYNGLQLDAGFKENRRLVPTTLKHLTITEDIRITSAVIVGIASLESIVIPEGFDDSTGILVTGCDSLVLNQYGNAGYIGTPTNPYYMLAKVGTDVTSCTVHPDAKVIGSYSFSDADRLVEVTVPGNIEYISVGAFSDMDLLESVVIESGVKTLCHSAFKDSPKLESVTLPSTLKSIGDNAFENCTSLRSIRIPASVSTIYTNAFSGSGLTYAYFSNYTWYCGTTIVSYHMAPGGRAYYLEDPETAADYLRVRYSNVIWRDTD